MQSRKYAFGKYYVALSYIRWVFDTVCYDRQENVKLAKEVLEMQGGMQEIAAVRKEGRYEKGKRRRRVDIWTENRKG